MSSRYCENHMKAAQLMCCTVISFGSGQIARFSSKETWRPRALHGTSHIDTKRAALIVWPGYGLFEDYPPCESSTLKPAFGLKKKSKGTFLEL